MKEISDNYWDMIITFPLYCMGKQMDIESNDKFSYEYRTKEEILLQK